VRACNLASRSRGVARVERQTARVSSVLAALLGVPAIVFIVLAVHARTMHGQGKVIQRVNRDDWHGVREAATALVEARSPWVARAAVAHASVVLGVAHLVLGDLEAARRSLNDALNRDLPAPLRAMAERQLASVERTAGDFDAALARLARPEASASDEDAWAVAMQVALVHLDRLDSAAAEAAALPAVEVLRRRAGGRSLVAQAHAADLAQARCLLARARIERGDLVGAAAEVSAAGSPEDKAYLRAQIDEVRARLHLARGEQTAALAAAESAAARFADVGAAIDLARNGVLTARIRRDATGLAAAEQRLRELGALGHLPEVEAARREIG